MTTDSRNLQRYCLVTVGATVGFKELTKEVLQPAFWQFLSSQGFTELHVQCGPDIPWATARFADHKNELPNDIRIEVFDVKSNLMKDEMVLCQAQQGQRTQGLVISHAGQTPLLLKRKGIIVADIQSTYRHWNYSRCVENGTPPCGCSQYPLAR